jgi:aarF domain-containing kinase
MIQIIQWFSTNIMCLTFFHQVCAYKDGKVIIDTAAGMLGKYDPRPVQPDSLFPVFSVTKGVTAGMVHWLVNEG